MDGGWKQKVSAMNNEELAALRDYVTAGDATRYDGLGPGAMRMDVTHSNLEQRWHDLLFHEDMTVQSVKEKLYRHCGSGISHMELYLRRGGDTMFLYDDRKTLKHYGAGNGMEIHIKDTDVYSLSRNGGLEDVSQVEKYNISEEDYEKRANTVRAYKRAEEQRKAQQAARRESGEGESLEPEEGSANQLTMAELTAAYPIGSRCEVQPGGRRGGIAFVGPVANTNGLWVGVCLDEPQGMNDGTKDGKHYFDCPGPKYGCFCKPEHVKVGDFPPIDPFASDDEF